MDIRKIKKLIELLEESSLTEIEIVEGYEDFEEVVSSICELKPKLKATRVSN